MLWLIPAAPILGTAAVEWSRSLMSRRPAFVVAPALVLVLAVIGTVLQEVNAVFDADYFAVRGVTTNAQDLFAVQGLDYLVSSDQRLSEAQETTLKAVMRNTRRRQVVMGDLFLIRALPAFTTRLIPFTTASAPRTDIAVRDMDTLLETDTPLALRRAILATHGVRYVLLPVDAPALADLQGRRGVRSAYRNARYVLLQVQRIPELSTPLLALDGIDVWRAGLRPGYRDGSPGIVARMVLTATHELVPGTILRARLIDPSEDTASEALKDLVVDELVVPFHLRARVPAELPVGDYALALTTITPGKTDVSEGILAQVKVVADPDPSSSGHELRVVIDR
jgi:hypothetical protein